MKQIKELQLLWNKKTMEVELIKEAVYIECQKRGIAQPENGK